jgi:hypothetical protein
MGYFVGELVLKRDGSKHWETAEDLLYVTNAARRINVPKGFETDGASIPRLFWPIVGHPLNGKHARAATVHDYLYFTGEGSKESADRIFLEAMKTDGVSKLRRNIMYYAVKWFGKGSYEAYR